ncbi:MAG: 3-hydroxybutyryl-CoA dehydrogenase [Tabrizicola sp.]|nr:3-hydroxybutyryl-CoA dehydrogenase [Tabrizicola sp.]
MIAVIGLGTMGLGIAQLFAGAGFSVVVTDVDGATRGSAKDRVAQAFNRRVSDGKLAPDARDAALARLTVVEDIAAMAGAELVIEAIAERLGTKQRLLAALERVVAPDAVLATNTSSLSVAAIATGRTHPERVLGLHFFNPAPVMALVELIAHPGTSGAATGVARRLAEAAGKTVVAAPDRPGFVVNRCARPFYGEALAMLEEGRSAADIDAAMRAAGYRLGPFQLIDLIGADINLAATATLYAAMGHHPRYHPFAALSSQVARGDLGRKTGRGFLFPAEPGSAPLDGAAIVLRIEATLINEAGWLLAEGGMTPQAIDTALRLGLNFPRGPFAMLADHGRERVRAVLQALEARTPFPGRYALSPILEAA